MSREELLRGMTDDTKRFGKAAHDVEFPLPDFYEGAVAQELPFPAKEVYVA